MELRIVNPLDVLCKSALPLDYCEKLMVTKLILPMLSKPLFTMRIMYSSGDKTMKYGPTKD